LLAKCLLPTPYSGYPERHAVGKVEDEAFKNWFTAATVGTTKGPRLKGRLGRWVIRPAGWRWAEVPKTVLARLAIWLSGSLKAAAEKRAARDKAKAGGQASAD
jgi:hypothetical protein